ncbi:hypothetical protein EDD80_101415 [Anseongella ginsenosidimutans]|uniref:ATPase n=1 Tax=Anseongella ginsenosidimutans TaxID=496056 RepID=A0A4R3KYT4_9SPHI|nr:ATP-binding protein [Anseongella ginsenosidimutans]TCS90216.1 hypothetical protein EDD80_101415 [Anseongella ginsenosidimutans]
MADNTEISLAISDSFYLLLAGNNSWYDEKLIGRSSEIAQLKEALASNEAELIAIYGRRRVGKTFLVRNVYKSELIFEMTGLQYASIRDQLRIFSRDLG